jgi:DNA-binding response OmpR family regulator
MNGVGFRLPGKAKGKPQRSTLGHRPNGGFHLTQHTLSPLQRRILWVRGEGEGCPSLISELESDIKLAVSVARTGAEGLELVERASPAFEALLVHVDLPDMQGHVICGRLRAVGINTPVLLLSEDGTKAEAVQCLNAGANDYVHAPFHVAEVRARIAAQIRAHESSEGAVLMIGPLRFRPAGRLLQNTHTGLRARLTEKEAGMLKILCRAAGPISRDTLMHEVWSYKPGVNSHTVETHMYRLRRKLELDTNLVSIVSEVGGYRLCIESNGDVGEPSPDIETTLAA